MAPFPSPGLKLTKRCVWMGTGGPLAMIIPSVIIPTYVFYAVYLVGVLVYLKRYILRPPAPRAIPAEEDESTTST